MRKKLTTENASAVSKRRQPPSRLVEITNSPEIRLNREVSGVCFKPSDWRIENHSPEQAQSRIYHRSTHSTFLIAFNLNGSDNLFDDVTARLVNVRDACSMPESAEMVSLARTAIVAFLVQAGVWPWPIDVTGGPFESRSQKTGAFALPDGSSG